MELMNVKDELKFVMVIGGEQSVMMPGALPMQM